MHRRFLYVGGSLAILALVTLLGLAFITVNSRSATPTPLVCAPPEEWISYHDPVGGMTVLYPPEAMFEAEQVYARTDYLKGQMPPFTIRLEIYPACNSYNPECYESMRINITVWENIETLSLDEYVIETFDGSGVATTRVLYQYAEPFTLSGHNAIRFSQPYESPDWVRRITGTPTRPSVPTTFVEQGPYIIHIEMLPQFLAIDALYKPPCAQAIQIYDDIVNRIQFDQ